MNINIRRKPCKIVLWQIRRMNNWRFVWRSKTYFTHQLTACHISRDFSSQTVCNTLISFQVVDVSWRNSWFCLQLPFELRWPIAFEVDATCQLNVIKLFDGNFIFLNLTGKTWRRRSYLTKQIFNQRLTKFIILCTIF